MKISIYKKTLHFAFQVNTSRGSYNEKNIYILKIEDKNGIGYGECAPLYDLSCDFNENYETNLIKICSDVQKKGFIDYTAYKNYSSILMGLETAFMHIQANSLSFFDNDFCNGKKGILINGLVWMGDIDLMKQRLYDKIKAGFSCIKIKIGAYDFSKEYELIKIIRDEFSEKDLTIRLDANCAYDYHTALTILNKLYPLNIHSIEQPIKVGQYEKMFQLVKQSPIKIALDEELIGIHSLALKQKCLESIQPDYIILKPTLHGGFKSCDEWITLCKDYQIDFWITSALESNIGLNAIAQYASTKDIDIPQGLGTGLLFRDNIHYGLFIKGQQLYFDKNVKVDFESFLHEKDKIY